MIVRSNLANITNSINKNNNPPEVIKPQVGKVFGIITTKDTPTKELFETNGGWSGIGTVFYLDYENSLDLKKENVDLKSCKVAKPFHASQQNYPLIGELIHILELPSPSTQIGKFISQKYYTGVINIWNNNQQNSPTNDDLGKSFSEKADIRNLLSFEGDRIYPGRKGNGLRFGSTVQLYSDLNEWSSVGEDGDPITILVNGYVTTDSGSFTPNIEEINKEQSSIYLTTTQKLPLNPGASIINPRVNTLKPKDYISSQMIANSNRITLNAKQDEILLFAKGNIEINTDNIINLNAGKVIHLHIDPKNSESKIALGTKSDGSYPTEPVILGSQMIYAFDILIGALSNLAGNLTLAATQDGPVAGCKNGGQQLFSDLKRLCDQLDKVLSTKVTTI